MHDLKTITALGSTEPRIDTFAHVTISENDGLALASIAARLGQENTCHTALKDLLGQVPEVGKTQQTEPFAGFWIGPEQWMVSAPGDRHELLANDLKSRFGACASITEQSGAWVCFDLTGPGLEDVFERSSAVNIRQMQAGDAQRTIIHQLGCFVVRTSKTDIRILGPRASAGSLHHALVTSARSTA